MSSDNDKKKIVHVHLPESETYKTTLTAEPHELIADEPERVEGGTDQGPDPYDYLLMALGSCTVITVKMYARRKEWPVEDIYLELTHNKSHDEDCRNCEEKESRIDVIGKELIVEGELTDEQLDRLLDISKKCPVHRTLLGDIRIESTIQNGVGS